MVSTPDSSSSHVTFSPHSPDVSSTALAAMSSFVSEAVHVIAPANDVIASTPAVSADSIFLDFIIIPFLLNAMTASITRFFLLIVLFQKFHP